MKYIFFIVGLFLLIGSHCNAQERVSKEKIKITDNLLGELKNAKGWMHSPGDEWVSLNNTIPQELSLSERNLLTFEKIGLGVDNFINYQLKEIVYRDTTYLLLIKKFRDGKYRYPNIHEEWLSYTSYVTYVIDKDEFISKIKSIQPDKINKIELSVLDRTIATQKTDSEIKSYIIDAIDLRYKKPTFIFTENCHMKLILHIAPYKEKHIVQFQIYSTCGDNYITYSGLIDNITYNENYFNYGSEKLFKKCYYETSFIEFNNFIKLE